MWRAILSHLLVQFLVLLSILNLEITHAEFVKPNCNHTCGDVKIPFPFGIGNGCFYDKWFEIECKPASPNSKGSILKPFLSKFNFEVMEVNLDGYQQTVKVGITPLNSCSVYKHQPFNLGLSPYEFSREDNVFFMQGCPGSAILVNQSKTTMAGCGTVCNNSNSEIHTNNCFGVHCCQTPLPSADYYSYSPFKFYNIDFNNQSSGENQNCLLATIMGSDYVNEYVGKLSSSDPPSRVPVVLLWSLTGKVQAPAEWSNGPNTRCYTDKYNKSFCRCRAGYFGNPYISNGCQVNHGCNHTCGDVIIPFPFGIGKSCFQDDWFEIECKTASPNSNGAIVKPFLSKLNVEFIEVNLDGYRPTVKVGLTPTNSCIVDTQQPFNLGGSPYEFSREDNVFVMQGCPGSATLANQSKTTMAGCGTVCNSSNSAIHTNNCYGVHCCQTPLPSADSYSYSPFQFYNIDFNNQSSGENQNCLLATIMGSDYVNEYVGKLSSSDPPSRVPVVLFWSATTFILQRHWSKRFYVINGLGISFVTVLLVIGIYGLYRFIKRRRESRRRAKFFKRNGGLLLQQQLSSNEGIVERTRIFSMSELDKATDHFNENRILGQGGQGTVYKGMLTDGGIVAIKKAKLLDESQLEQFINEVVILSQINHRNVVKLLGCCLEAEIPLLVYEFIPNGTLFKHIHDPDEDFVISWEMCLKIAADSAAAVAYLHSSASIPIYHRDIKSSNILLDEKHKAKVSDFGSSRTIAIDQTHLTTLVQGTMGYLDPEYFQSYHFTEKSDVYSFGVVLLELLTRKKPIYRAGNTMEQKSLVTEFLFLTQNSRLSDILDPTIVRDAKEDELIAIVELTKRCISWSGNLRPTMKEVAMTLEMIIKSPAQVSRWYQEQEPFPISEGGFDEHAMIDVSDADFPSSTVPAGSSSPPYSDVHPFYLTPNDF